MPWEMVAGIDVENVDRKNKNVNNAFYEKMKKPLKHWIKHIVDKLRKLIKPNEKFPSKITILICTTTFEGYALHERTFYNGYVKALT